MAIGKDFTVSKESGTGSMKVKVLEWKEDVRGGEDVCAEGLFGEYHICRGNHGYGDLWSATFNEEFGCQPGKCDGRRVIYTHSQIGRVKECCQIHHEKRVRKALGFVEGMCSAQQ